MATLVVVEGPSEGAQFPLIEPLVSLGRDDTCTYQVLDPLVSRKHLQVRLDDKLGKHVAGDYRSANGVFVNDKLIVLTTALEDGDRIKIGGTTLVYLAAEYHDAPAALAAAKKLGEWKRSTLMRPN
jgi:pSer/pThr/pTyr-binding forkhead associated (FHA) protein